MIKNLFRKRNRKPSRKVSRKTFFEPLEDRRMLVAEMEPNDFIADAQVLVFSQSGSASINGAHDVRGDVDYFKLVAASPGSVRATLGYASRSGDLDLTLLNTIGNTIDHSSIGGGSEEVNAQVVAGVYYARVQGASSLTGRFPYSLVVEAPINQPAPTLSIAAAIADKNERDTGQTPFTFTVARGGDTSGQTMVDWAVTGTGTNPANAADFVGNSFPNDTLTFNANETTKTITVNVAGDSTFEQDEGFSVRLSNASGGASITTATATGNIRNDDPAPVPTLSIAATDANKNEGNTGETEFRFTVTRGGVTTGVTTVNYAVTGNTTNPANAADFVGNAFPNDTLTFNANELTPKTITVKVAGDSTFEPDEGFSVTLSNASGNASITTASANGVIQNDDDGGGGGDCPSDVVCDQEENDRFAAAQPLGTKTKIQGTMEVAKGTGNSTIGQKLRIPDPDFYKFTTAALGTYKITANVDRIAHTPTLTLYDRDEQVIERQVLTSSTQAVSITKPLAAGDYFISFSGEQNYSGSNVLALNYEIDVDRIPTGGGSGGGSGTICDANGNCVEQENNDTKEAANNLGTLAGPITLTGNIEITNGAGNSRIAELTRIPGSDFFRFEVNTPGQYEGTATVDRLVHQPKVHILDESGNLLTTNEFGSSKNISIRGYLDRGVYFFQVTGEQNTSGSSVKPNYTISISPVTAPSQIGFDIEPSNDTPAGATPLGELTEPQVIVIKGVLEFSKIAGNNHLASLLRIPGHDYYAFEIGTEQDRNVTIRFNVDRVQHRPTVNLYDRATQELIATREITSASLGIEFTQFLKSGEYLVEVTGQANSSGSDVAPNYTLQLTPLVETLPPNAGAEQEQPDGFTNDTFATAENLGTISSRREVRGHFDVKPGTGNSPIAMQNRIPDQDFFRFQVASEQTYLISVKNLNRLAHDPTLTLYRSNQSVIDSQPVETINGVTLEARLTPGVDYYVSLAAEPNSTGSNVEFDYTLVVDTAIVTPIDGAEIEGNDSLSAANDLGVLDSEVKHVNGTLSVRQGLGNSPIGERKRFPNPDFFRFKLDSQQEVTIGITLDRFQHNPVLTLFELDDQGDVKQEHQYPLPDKDGVVVRETLAAGDYAVSISAPQNSSGSDAEPNYVLTLESVTPGQGQGEDIDDGVEREANDSFGTANQIGVVKDFETVVGNIYATPSVGNNHLAEITSYPNPDYFAFSTERAGPASIILTTDRLPYPITMELYDSSRHLLQKSRLVEGRRATLNRNIPAGDYFVVLSGPAVATRVNVQPNYTLAIDAFNPTLPADALETNNDRAHATLVTMNTKFAGLTIHNDSDVDYFKLTLTADGTAENFIQLTHSTEGGADLDLFLENKHGNLLADSATSSSNERISLAGRAADTYYVRVEGYNHSIAAYDLQLNLPELHTGDDLPQDRFELNDDFTQATQLGPVEGDRRIDGLTIHLRDVSNANGDPIQVPDIDYFSFDLLNDGSRAHSLKAIPSVRGMASQMSIELYAERNGGREQIAGGVEAFGAQAILLDGLPPGRYYAVVTSNTEVEYALRLSVPYRPDGYDITYEIQGAVQPPPGFEDALRSAIARWEEVIVGDVPPARTRLDMTDWEEVTERVFGTRYDLPSGKLVDDLHIVVQIGYIDGAVADGGYTLASAIELQLRPDQRTILGAIEVDKDDLSQALASGTLVGTLIHEIGHVIARPNYWGDEGFISIEHGLYAFNGNSALAEYRLLTGDPNQSVVPIQQTGDPEFPYGGHWDEATFQTELMTPETDLVSFEPLSALTIAQLQDLGYKVNFSAADPYTLPPRASGESPQIHTQPQTATGGGEGAD
ncbi:MAG: pre-peptidase C-terminal domain-containing protein, partial [Planctomycetales bacterium]|nr:pre-peptidase C-terminal domain-containing protein [Planctomycetales bacterium]